MQPCLWPRLASCVVMSHRDGKGNVVEARGGRRWKRRTISLGGAWRCLQVEEKKPLEWKVGRTKSGARFSRKQQDPKATALLSHSTMRPLRHKARRPPAHRVTEGQPTASSELQDLAFRIIFTTVIFLSLETEKETTYCISVPCWKGHSVRESSIKLQRAKSPFVMDKVQRASAANIPWTGYSKDLNLGQSGQNTHKLSLTQWAISPRLGHYCFIITFVATSGFCSSVFSR